MAATTDNAKSSDQALDQSTQIGVTATGRTVDLTGLDIGAVVKVKGGVGVYRGQKQVLLERLCTFISSSIVICD